MNGLFSILSNGSQIGNNPETKYMLPVLVGLAIFLGGCRFQADNTSRVSEKPIDRNIPVDDFGLPLVIRMAAPEVPPEVARPTSSTK